MAEKPKDPKTAESALALATREWGSIFDVITDAVCLLDLEGTILRSNKAYAQFVGRSHHRILGENCCDLVHGEGGHPPECPLPRMLRTKTHTEAEFLIGDRWVWAAADPLLDDTGALIGAVHSLADIRERKRNEQRLAFLASIVESSDDAIIAKDLEGTILSWNRGAERVYGYTAEEILGRSIDVLVPPDRTSELPAILARVRRGESIGHFETERSRKDGARIHVSLTISAVRDRTGAIVGASTIAREITERRRAEDALRESEVRYRMLFESANDAIFLVKDGRFVDCNAKTIEVFGCSREQILYHSPAEFSPETQRDGSTSARSSEARTEAALAGAPQSFEWLHCRHDRSVFDAEVSLKRVEIGGEAFLQAIVRDITAHKRADDLQAAIYEISEAAQQATRLDDLFAAVHRIVGRLMDAKNLYIALYDSTTNLLSFPYFVDEIDARPEPFPAEKGMTSYVVRSGQPLLATPEVLRDFEERGEIEPLGAASLDWLGVPLKVQDRVIGVLAVQSYSGQVRYSEAEKGILAYVSAQVAQAVERKRAEEALRESEARFRRSIEELSDGFALIDEQGNVIEWNPALERIDGIKREEALGLPLWDVQWRVYLAERRTPERYQFLKRSVLDAVQTGMLPTPPSQIDIWSLDGRRRTVTQSVFRIQTLKGFRVGMVIRDITERIELEAQLRQAQKMEAVGRLAGGIAHDFNNVLQTLLSLSQALGGQLDEPERFAATAMELQEQVKRGAALTRQLLLFSRSEPPRLERLDLNEVVNRSSRMVRRLLRENISLTLDLAERPIPVDGDVGQLEQVLINLVVNSADAMPQGGRLVIRTRFAGSAATLEVSDTGTGMADEIRARIFEPFFTTKEASKGTGLGLSVVHGIITGHGGHVEVQSVVGQGTTFRLALPLASSADQPVQLAPADPGRDIAVGGGERVLVVEDETGAREGLVQVLTMLGYQVTAVGSGAEAELLPGEPGFDLLLTDYLLPDALGTDLAVALKARWPRVKVVLMSGYAEDEGLRRRIAAGAIRFLQKPFDMETVARELHAALAEPRSAGTP